MSDRVPGVDEVERRFAEMEDYRKRANIGSLVLHHTLLTSEDTPTRKFIMVYDGVLYGFTVERGVPSDFDDQEVRRG